MGDDDDNLREGERIDDLVARARRQSDPIAWIRERVGDALRRLDASDHASAVKLEAKRQLFEIEKRLIADLKRRR